MVLDLHKNLHEEFYRVLICLITIKLEQLHLEEALNGSRPLGGPKIPKGFEGPEETLEANSNYRPLGALEALKDF